MKIFTPTFQNGWKLNKGEWETESPEETLALGVNIGRVLQPNTILCFFGDLAAGKTTFIKGIVNSVTGISSDEVMSPTFVYLTPYKGSKGPVVYHFDLYRLQGVEEFLSMGFEDFFFAEGICCIEWSERIASLIPPHAFILHMTHKENNRRHIRLTSYDTVSL